MFRRKMPAVEMVGFMIFQDWQPRSGTIGDLIGCGFGSVMAKELPGPLPRMGIFTAWKRQPTEPETSSAEIWLEQRETGDSRIICQIQPVFGAGDEYTIFVPPGQVVFIPSQGIYRFFALASGRRFNCWDLRVSSLQI